MLDNMLGGSEPQLSCLDLVLRGFSTFHESSYRGVFISAELGDFFNKNTLSELSLRYFSSCFL